MPRSLYCYSFVWEQRPWLVSLQIVTNSSTLEIHGHEQIPWSRCISLKLAKSNTLTCYRLQLKLELNTPQNAPRRKISGIIYNAKRTFWHLNLKTKDLVPLS